jgi:hypothetical protein
MQGEGFEMTVKELIERLNELPQDLHDMVVYIHNDGEPYEFEFVDVVSDAIVTSEWRPVLRKVLAIHNGEEIQVEVRDQQPFYTDHPGVVLS